MWPAAAPPPLVLQVGCGMLALVAAAIVYIVILSNQVNGGREDLRDIATNLQQSEQKAAALKPYDDFAKATQKRHDAVASVAKTRFKWDRTMTELARVAPDGVWLTSAKATLTPTTQVEGGGGGTSGLRSVLSSPAVELAGCAASEKSVPSYIDRLHLMTGVTTSASAAPRTDAVAKNATAAAASAGGCQSTGDKKSSSFELVTYFKQQSAPVAAGATTTTPATGATPRRSGIDSGHGAGQPDRRGNDRRHAMTSNDRKTIALVALAGIADPGGPVDARRSAPSAKSAPRCVRTSPPSRQRLQAAQTQLAVLRGRQQAVPRQARGAQARSTRPCRRVARSRRCCVSCSAGRTSATATCASWP